MAGTVQVTFGANIQPLVDGVESAKTAVQSFMSAFAADKLASFTEEYAKLGDQIETSAKQFGTSVAQYQEIGYAAKMAGGDQEGLVNSLGRLQLELQQAQNPTSRQAQALNALGLSAKALIGLPLEQQLAKVADAFTKFADGPNKAAIAQALFRNSSGEMIEVLDQGSAGLARLRQQAIDTGAILGGQTVGALSALDRANIAARASLNALAATILGGLAPELTKAANAVTAFVADITFAVDAGKFWQEQINSLEWAIASMALSVAHAGQILGDFFKLDWNAVAADWKRGEAEQQDLMRQYQAQVHDIAQQGKAQLAADMAPPAATSLPQAPAMDVMGRDQLSAVLENINAMEAAQDRYYQQQSERIGSLKTGFIGAEAQKAAALTAAVNSREAMEENEVQMGLQLQGLTASQHQKLQDELTKIQQKAALDRAKITQEEVAAYQKQWTSALNTIEGAFNSQLRGLLAGTTTWQQAWKAMLGDMIIKFIEMCESMVVKWAAAQLAQTTATVTGASARTAAETTASSAGVLAMVGNAVKAIMTDAAQAFGGVFAFLAPVMGPAAAGPAAAAQASVSAAAIFDVGTDYVQRGGLALIHPGEEIKPAQGSGPWTGRNSGGGGTANFGDIHIHSAPGQSVDYAQLTRQITKEMRRAGVFTPNKLRMA